MNNLYLLSDEDIIRHISAKVKELRLKQNMSQNELAQKAGISLSSMVRAEEGVIKSVDVLLRILRTLGKLEVLQPLIDKEPISPETYFKLTQQQQHPARKRAAKNKSYTPQEETTW